MAGSASYDPVQQYEVRIFDVEYRRDGGQSWLARIYQPQGDGPFPALLYVHGGAWSAQDRTSSEPLMQVLASSGLVVASLDYRLAPQHPYPAQVADTNFATRWLKTHAAEFSADPHGLGGLGLSSGGHTVMLSAMRPHDPRYAALPLGEAPEVDATLSYIVAAFPIMDAYARYRYAQDAGMARLVAAGEGYFLTEEAMQEGNPQRILDRGETVQLPPTLILQGTEDNNIPFALNDRFAASYRAAGGVVEFELFQGMPHGFGGWPEPEMQRALGLMKAFIARQLTARAVPR